MGCFFTQKQQKGYIIREGREDMLFVFKAPVPIQRLPSAMGCNFQNYWLVVPTQAEKAALTGRIQEPGKRVACRTSAFGRAACFLALG